MESLKMLFKTEIYTMPEIFDGVYTCTICGKEFFSKDQYTFITNSGLLKRINASGFTCTNEECIQMRIFQMME
jgi:DNA-directed RNA polymerase subunit RPC12/RpoP